MTIDWERYSGYSLTNIALRPLLYREWLRTSNTVRVRKEEGDGKSQTTESLLI